MRKYLVISAVLLLAVFSSHAQYRPDAAYDDLYDGETASLLKTHVRNLASASMEGRKSGSEGERAAAEYVESVFNEYGLDMLSPEGGDVFGIKSDSGDIMTSRNVIGVVQGYDKKLKNEYIVIGARLDNLGTLTMTVDGVPVERIFYGANGNASGLAMLMELAGRVRMNSILFRRSVIFAAFGSSADTYAGAWYFLNRSFKDVDYINAMVNLDMLGTGYNGFYAYTSSNYDMNGLIAKVSSELQPIVPEIIAEEPYPSDHRAFYSKEIPSVMFTTGRYPQHNTDKDTPSLLSYDVMEREMEYIYNFITAIANTDSEMAFRSNKVVSRGPAYDDVVSYYDCDQRPMFLNSADPRQFMEKWVYQYLKYPEKAVREGIQGRVLVDFIIEKDGSVKDVRVLRGVSEELDAEAVKVVSASPKWRPGKVKGSKVRSSMTVTIEFRLEKKDGKPSFGIRK